MQDLFKSYRESYYMVNVNSELMPIIMALQYFKMESKLYNKGKVKWDKIVKDFFHESTRKTMMN